MVREKDVPPGLPPDFYEQPIRSRVDGLINLYKEKQPVTITQVRCCTSVLFAAMRSKFLGYPTDTEAFAVAARTMYKAAQVSFLLKKRYRLQKGKESFRKWSEYPIPNEGVGRCVAYANAYANAYFRSKRVDDAAIQAERERLRVAFIQSVMTEFRHPEHYEKKRASGRIMTRYTKKRKVAGK